MIDPLRTERRYAALLLRWAAQIVSGEDPAILTACTVPLHATGLDMAALERQAHAWADAALALITELPHA